MNGDEPPRYFMPDPDTSLDNSTSNASSSQTQIRRRRSHGVITPHACTECRKKRVKCDGKLACSRCKSYNIECIYTAPLIRTKGSLRAELEQLRRREDSVSRVMAALGGRAEVSDQVMMRLWNGHSIEHVSRWLVDEPTQNGELSDPQPSGDTPRAQESRDASPSSSSPPLLSPHESHSTVQDGSSIHSALHGGGSILWPSGEPASEVIASWTRMTSDTGLVRHLLALYFCWEHPTFVSLSREHYLRDFHDGKTRYCSAMLTNALLALASRLSSRPALRTEAGPPAGQQFFQECQRLYLDETDHHRLTTVQALGIMSLREVSCGHLSASEYYAGQCMRLALEMGLHDLQSLDTRDEEEMQDRTVKLATFWGAFALNNALSFAGSLPRTSSMPSLPIKLPTMEALEAHAWIPYTDDDVPLELPYRQPSNERSVFALFCQLSGLAHQSVYLIHDPSQQLTAKTLLHHYTKYLLWYDSLPEALRLGQNFTPHVLFAHMYYHFAIVMLFWPVVEYEIIGTELSPKHICTEAADAIVTLLKSYASLYTLGRTPSLTPYLTLTAAVVHLAASTNFKYHTTNTIKSQYEDLTFPRRRDSGSSGSSSNGASFSALRADVAMLENMTQSHHLARKALGILAMLFEKWDVDIEIAAARVSLQDCIDLCWPYNWTHQQRGPPLGFSSEHLNWEMDEDGKEEQVRITEMTTESLQHPLFVPLLELRKYGGLTEEALDRAGFSHLP
ncbi:hypothetical protein E4U39_005462 [Claviceps sp. Clav50 group G5]|nr:hypothetical protein E4U39_005462 [Claviceps sp. Clav50 group G5]